MLEWLFLPLVYLIGSIPTAVWLGNYFYGVDVRKHGSRNAGATNTFRVLGKPMGFVVLAIDTLKGFAAISFTKIIIPDHQIEYYQLLIAGVVCVLGHVYSVFVKFNGGKGVATSLGVYLAINPLPALLVVILFLIIFLVTRFVSLASLSAAICLPFVSYFILQQTEPLPVIFNFTVSALVVFTHSKNIKRLIKGNEPKMNFSKKKA